MSRRAHLLGRALRRLGAFTATLGQHSRDEWLEEWTGLKRIQYDIDNSVEFRSKEQIHLSPSLVIKGHAILNGRSTTHDFGLRLGPETYLKERCIADAYGGHINIRGPAGIAQDAFLHGGGGIDIGRYVIMGPRCSIIASNHAFSSTDLPIMLQGDRRRGIVIGSNVWLGAGVTILDGVSVGNNVVIGAGVIISENIPNNTIVRASRNYSTEELRFKP
ncbi:hypothetical protein CH252_21145 [Rhodococcus sp. 06-1477-1B]|nr:hypothetical protein CH252_21145 [Rhodococcus sp. 06-1477-1B]